jgi:hypothetical protein
MSSSSSSAANASPADSLSEDTLSGLATVELQPGHTVEFGVSRISSVHVQDMQQLGYFGNGVARVPGAEEILEPQGELVVFEAFFIAGLRLPAHRFVAEVLQRFEVQVHQLTPNVVVALAKYVWARDGNGYPLPKTRWVFALLGYGFGSISVPMGLLMGSNGNPTGTWA